MKKLLLLLITALSCTTTFAQIHVSKKYKGSVIIRNDVHQVGTLNVRISGDNVQIISQINPGATYAGRYDYFINPDTELPFTSLAAFRLFAQDNFFSNPTNTVDTGASYSINLQTFDGEADNSYTLDYVPVAGTITATVNGVQELVNYAGTGQVVTINPAYAVDDTDVVIITYSYSN
jgi:hypothetical protein